MDRHDPTDAQRAVIEPLLPPTKMRGVPRVDDRRVINAILWRFCAGTPWRDVPERYGPRMTRDNRFAGARLASGTAFSMRCQTRGMGRSRGGLTTKIHALLDAEGRPVRLALTPGQAGEAAAARDLIGDLGQGSILIADRADDTDAIRDHAKPCGAWANVPPRTIRNRAFPFSRLVDRQRNLVERVFNRIKPFAASPRAATAGPTTSSPR